mmetsp:Transcript_32363/g.43777  ORF Transcript_32363/g.43777 Transcript_32363/m.43777 type:complete len:575 (-) Transcript_32363:282-2006(-)
MASNKKQRRCKNANEPPPPAVTKASQDDEKYDLVTASIKGVVQCFNNSVHNDWTRPWTMQAPAALYGSGFIVSVKRRLMVTNAHVVSFASTFQVRKDGDFNKYEAVILATSHQVDLALITVDDDDFWDDAIELEVGVSPRMQQSVDVVGYPMGGDGISITAGIVSRIDWGDYSHSDERNLVVTVDAAINSGNSGGPALSGGKVVGVAFQSYAGDADNIGYIVPVEVLNRMLEDFDSSVVGAKVAKGGSRRKSRAAAAPKKPQAALRGFARFVPQFQSCENAALRRSVGMPEGASGVLVHQVSRVSNLHGVLLVGDVIMAVDGDEVSNDGRIKRPGISPIDFRLSVSMKLVGEPIGLTVVRGGKKVQIRTVGEDPMRLTPHTWYGPTSYCLFAGLVFCPLHEHHSRHSKAGNIAYYRTIQTTETWHSEGRKHERVGQQVVGLATILPHSLTLGYEAENYRDMHLPLLEVDGSSVQNCADVYRLTRAARGPWITFLFGHSKRVVLPLAEARTVTVDIMAQHHISNDASADIIEAATGNGGGGADLWITGKNEELGEAKGGDASAKKKAGGGKKRKK